MRPHVRHRCFRGVLSPLVVYHGHPEAIRQIFHFRRRPLKNRFDDTLNFVPRDKKKKQRKILHALFIINFCPRGIFQISKTSWKMVIMV